MSERTREEPTAEEVDNLRWSKRKLRNEEEGHEESQTKRGPKTQQSSGSRQPVAEGQGRRSYVSMVKGPDFVYDTDTTDESESEGEDSKEESEFEYSDMEGADPKSAAWKIKRE
ncbi:hypothetical protein PIB30_058228 [Stylosanthes scabra]|uniref:Uncharacterized protein n=1 Tax=Stylosanthes scabra TaxID=79078 RepID=A0ABU6TJN7_9FABA|nr:hypothetical protein [Stylosanthes scabra]